MWHIVYQWNTARMDVDTEICRNIRYIHWCSCSIDVFRKRTYSWVCIFSQVITMLLQARPRREGQRRKRGWDLIRSKKWGHHSEKERSWGLKKKCSILTDAEITHKCTPAIERRKWEHVQKATIMSSITYWNLIKGCPIFHVPTQNVHQLLMCWVIGGSHLPTRPLPISDTW